MSRIVEGLVKSGQHKNLMSIPLEQNWGSTTTAGIQVVFFLRESGASPLTQMSYGITALFQYVMQHTTVKEVIRWVSLIQES